MNGSNTTALLRTRYQVSNSTLGHIPATSHGVWWLRRMASTFTLTEPIGLLPVGIHQTASVCNPSTPTLQELRNRITDDCTSVSSAMLYNVQRKMQSRV
ncbi:hypothetical protein AVEN_159742-1 [Araneus ventricosus]|uniref:Uncharacterized protein n=1 Tax=Araneus ventricosus TaxID=182803 RepID=A0A4Y2QHC4_ARAVE|nr:hypothetical protein AVEN_159742-1 [Araneus ventricosus]